MAELLAPLLLPLVGDDQDTVDYIVAALSEDGIGEEEVTEILEPYVEEADDPAAVRIT